MIVHIPQVLSPDELQTILQSLSQEAYIDGRATLEQGDRSVKNNLELPLDSALAIRLSDTITAALKRHPVFVHIVLPRRIGRFLFNRYQVGMTYGDHVDTIIQGLGSSNPVRVDVSITVFLSDPGSYEGGELVIDSDGSPRPVKLVAGDAIAYPANTTHRVERVTRGVRLAAVSWIQSIVPDPARRQILADLLVAKDIISRGEASAPQMTADASRLLYKSYNSLLQSWSQT